MSAATVCAVEPPSERDRGRPTQRSLGCATRASRQSRRQFQGLQGQRRRKRSAAWPVPTGWRSRRSSSRRCSMSMPMWSARRSRPLRAV